MSFFTGGNDLGLFAEGILTFGEAMKSYGDAVADIRPEAVESSASAGMALVELAKALPNTGGLLSFFTGGTDLAAFGDDLTLFGADLSAYAEAISNVKADAVTASANAAEALSNLASGLPDSSLFDKWFGGDQTLASFGGDISKFGAAMKDYYGQISGIDTGRMADVVAQVWSLLELAEGAAGVNTSGLTGFADSMRKMGDAGISGFTSAFYNCGDTVNKAVSSMLSTVSGAVLSNLPVTNGAMETVVQSLANIVDGKVPAIRTSTSDMMRTMEASITAHSRTVGDAMRTVLSTAVSNINRMKPEFETAGKNAGQGFINGINSKLGGEAEMRPTIRPVLDLSDLTGASTQIDSLFYPLRSIRLAGQASLAFQNASGENRMTVKVDNDDIIEELRTLRSEMAEMTERMERMRVVLDTGTLVGEMAGPMDNALGQRATRRGRGN